MRLEKGMKLTQTRSFKNFAMNLYEDDMNEWAWEITDIIDDKDKRLFSVVREPDMGVMVDEEALIYFFTPWCDWRKSPDGFEYKTNGRLVFVRQKFGEEYIKAKATCHALDDFDLEKGIEIARGRLELKIAQKHLNELRDIETLKVHKEYDVRFPSINKNNKIIGVGSIFGDLEVIAYAGKDTSRHNLWKCKCLICGNNVIMRSTNLRKSTSGCNKCRSKKRPSLNSDGMKNFIDNNLVWGSVNSNQTNTKKNCDNYYTKEHLKDDKSAILNFDLAKEFEWTNEHFTLRETTGDILEAPCYNYIVHPVSADLAMVEPIGKNKEIIELFDIKEELIDEIKFNKEMIQYNKEMYQHNHWSGYYNITNFSDNIRGEVITYNKNILSMIVVGHQSEPVTYHTIATGLKRLRSIVEGRHITHIAMPRICCEKDSGDKDWEIVRRYIIESFKDIDYNLIITIYHN